MIRTIKPATTGQHDSIYHALGNHGYRPQSSPPRVSIPVYVPRIVLVSPRDGHRTTFWPEWVRIVLREYDDAISFTDEWWTFAKRFRKHLVVLHRQVGGHETSEFLRWLTDPENMP